MPNGMPTQVGPRKHALDGMHWRHLANTIQPSMCCGDATFSSNYLDHLFKPGIQRVQAVPDISHSVLCCHSNETRAPIANPCN